LPGSYEPDYGEVAIALKPNAKVEASEAVLVVDSPRSWMLESRDHARRSNHGCFPYYDNWDFWSPLAEA